MTELEHADELIAELIAELRRTREDRARHEEKMMLQTMQSGEILTRLMQRAEQSIQNSEQLIAAINQLPKSTLEVVYKAVDQRMAQIGAEASKQVSNGIQVPLKDFVQDIKALRDPLVTDTNQLTGTLSKLENFTRGLMKKTNWMVYGGMAVLVIGSLGLSYFYQSVIQKNKIQADYVEAINHSSLSMCDGQMCGTTLDAKGKPQTVKIEPKR